MAPEATAGALPAAAGGWRWLLAAAAAAALIALTRFWGLGLRPPEHDDLHIWQEARAATVRGLVERAAAHGWPPLRAVALRAWMMLAGDDPAALMTLGAAASTLAALGVMALGWVRLGPASGVCAGLVLAVAPTEVVVERHPWGYGLVAILVVASLAAALWAFTGPRAGRTGPVAAYAAAATLGALCHGLFFITAAAVSLACLALPGRGVARPWRPVLLGNLVPAAVWLSWVLGVWWQTPHVTRYPPGPPLAPLGQWWAGLSSLHLGGEVLALLALVLVAGVVVGRAPLVVQQAAVPAVDPLLLARLALVAGLGVAALGAVTLAFTALGSSRYALLVSPALRLLQGHVLALPFVMAAGPVRGRWRRPVGLCGAALVLAFVLGEAAVLLRHERLVALPPPPSATALAWLDGVTPPTQRPLVMLCGDGFWHLRYQLARLARPGLGPPLVACTPAQLPPALGPGALGDGVWLVGPAAVHPAPQLMAAVSARAGGPLVERHAWQAAGWRAAWWTAPATPSADPPPSPAERATPTR